MTLVPESKGPGMAVSDPPTFKERFRRRRRKMVKRSGKRLIRKLSAFIGRQSLVEDSPIVSKAHFPQIELLEDNWEMIRSELDQILKFRESVPLFHDVSPDQKRISKGDNWRTFILFALGEKAETNCKQAPETSRLLEAVPNLQSAFFSILAPGYQIRAHRGVTKTLLRCHLGLIVPKDAENCTMRVDDQICVWREGEAFVFDDTYEHEVQNNTEDERVVLLFDFDRPMKFRGRILNRVFISLLKLTAYFREPKRRMRSYEDQFEDVVRTANR